MRKKRSNNIILSVVAKNGIIESILLIEAIWPRSVEDNNLRHRYEVLRIGDEVNLICKRTVDDFKMITAIKQIHNILCTEPELHIHLAKQKECKIVKKSNNADGLF
ncbi:putative recombinase, resolvase family [Trichinella spiralis]|uniref:putative recombinase, resolvase family n=1 Tax=Trichinella spiralis TaxID=6334 RepID=UPI0001EFDE52|nr:putative recombinase, resolvase family [Trichinella spiralis]